MGMDLSTLLAVEENGGKFYNHGTPGNAMEILQGYGMNLVRLRIWNDPFDEKGTSYGAGGCDIETVLALAKRAKRLGIGWLLDFHYSDFWADPGKQWVPKAWRGMNALELEQAIYDYTTEVLDRCGKEDVVPQMVAVGNELSNGFLWPLGQLPHGGSWKRLLEKKQSRSAVINEQSPGVVANEQSRKDVVEDQSQSNGMDEEREISPEGVRLSDAYKNVAAFVNAGIRAVRDFEARMNAGMKGGNLYSAAEPDLQDPEMSSADGAKPDSAKTGACKLPVMIHLDAGGDNELYRRWFDHYFANGGEDFEYIGLSYYPFWHGTLDKLQYNMNDIARRYGKKLIMAEVSMGFTMEDYASYERLMPSERKGMATKPDAVARVPYPMTPQGQADFMRDAIEVVRQVPDGLGCGFIYWEPAWIPVPNVGWANAASCEYIHDPGLYGNEWANQALFDYEGNALPALGVIGKYARK
ncbi:MAG: glycosyl hydrolase 53 family protein [Lachnospiraceae bacterium]|nr:glycosyl hydrolase 53 family protein [Lachnospiraceae bacterium]